MHVGEGQKAAASTKPSSDLTVFASVIELFSASVRYDGFTSGPTGIYN